MTEVSYLSGIYLSRVIVLFIHSAGLANEVYHLDIYGREYA